MFAAKSLCSLLGEFPSVHSQAPAAHLPTRVPSRLIPCAQGHALLGRPAFRSLDSQKRCTHARKRGGHWAGNSRFLATEMKGEEDQNGPFKQGLLLAGTAAPPPGLDGSETQPSHNPAGRPTPPP